MLENSAEVIEEHVKKYWWLILKTLWDFVWMIKLEKVELWKNILYEKWWLIIRPEYRNMWYATLLQILLTELYNDKPIYSVTNVDTVKNMNLKLWNVLFFKNKIKTDILSLIEKPWKLLEEDVVFFNKTALDLYDL
jgi:GNAT superfamily N-acetyltransferase